MAKSKKNESSEEPKPKPDAKKAKPAATKATPVAPVSAAKAAPKKAAAKAESRPRADLWAGAPMIDTGLAASAAANLLLAKRKGRDQIDDPISIDQIKSDLSKPAAAVAGDMLDQHAESSGTRRPDLPQTRGPQQHSQTVGNAAARTAVPRRTAG